MNYLGHAWSSGSNAAMLTGNMIGDFVKGRKQLESYPADIQKGIMLHRHIDSFADSHPAHVNARSIFRQDYGLYAGAVIDALMDYFIANDVSIFASETVLYDFSQNIYYKLEEKAQYFPEHFPQFFNSMRTHNWLYNYKFKDGTQRSLNGLYRRALHMAPPEKAFQLFEENEIFLKGLYQIFIADFKEYIAEYNQL